MGVEKPDEGSSDTFKIQFNDKCRPYPAKPQCYELVVKRDATLQELRHLVCKERDYQMGSFDFVLAVKVSSNKRNKNKNKNTKKQKEGNPHLTVFSSKGRRNAWSLL